MHGGRKQWAALGLVLVASVSTASPAGAVNGYAARVEQPDNVATFTWSESGQNGGASSVVGKPGDPLTFYVFAFPPPPGGNAAFVRVEMVNNGPGEVRFPTGLLVPVFLRNGSRVQVGMVRHPATRLAPGASVTAQGTVPLYGFGQYSVSAFSVVLRTP